VELYSIWTYVLVRSGSQTSEVCTNSEKAIGGHSEKVAICKLKRGLRRNPVCQCLDRLQNCAYRTVTKQLLLFKPPRLWRFVMASLAF
jgi:hypothetical protein